MTYQELEIDTPKPVFSWAGHDLAQAETKMAKNVASLPFVFKHVALMPDVHLGKGALVGLFLVQWAQNPTSSKVKVTQLVFVAARMVQGELCLDSLAERLRQRWQKIPIL